MKLDMIPVFEPDGSLARRSKLKRIQELLADRLVTVDRDSFGRIRRAYYRNGDGTPGVRPTAHMGQSYVHRELLPTGHHAYKHKPLPRGQADLFVRSIFRTVELSCMA